MVDRKYAAAEGVMEDREAACERTEGPFFVVREGNALARRFSDFGSAYRYALNLFGSEDFLVWREGW